MRDCYELCRGNARGPSWHEPRKGSRGVSSARAVYPQYRLGFGEIRVSYDVTGHTVDVLAIVPKWEAESWLARFGKAE